MRILLLLAAIVFSSRGFSMNRAGGTYHGYNDGAVCYFDIWTDFKNLKFQAMGDFVVLGAQGISIAPNKVRYEGTVWFDYATSTYVPVEPHYAGAQYKFTVIIEYGRYGELNVVVTRDKVSGWLPGIYTKVTKCEDIRLVKAYRRNPYASTSTCEAAAASL